MRWLKQQGSDCLLSLFIQAGAKRSVIVGEHDDRLKIRIAAMRADGRANAELMHFLGELFGATKTDLSILKGEFSKYKIIKISNIRYEDVVSKVQCQIKEAGRSLARKK